MSVIDVAISQVGTKSKGNNNKYNTDFYGHTVKGDAYPWCAVFVWWCAKKLVKTVFRRQHPFQTYSGMPRKTDVLNPEDICPRLETYLFIRPKRSHIQGSS